ncbi:hypothetical protein [Albidovulum sediminis]|uniref:Uncharacterized protein n=1 Tax=Albidovulum sediminis TaxID=3066345 RepID=A0ABT2NRY6_9RHOB|nr:hypothetical protein [Defluviimonas sediminis]MCT8331692.1 hypothetical protein [Defluviimonas sediminis]
MKGAWACLVVALACVPAQAETVSVRSGEHDGFTRIVVDLPEGTGWALGRSDAGYELRLDRRDVEFDLRRAFAPIPRDRIADMVPAPGGGRLTFVVTCECHAAAFATASGGVAVDVRTGPPGPGAAYERPLAPFPDPVQEGARPSLLPTLEAGDAAPPTPASLPATDGKGQPDGSPAAPARVASDGYSGPAVNPVQILPLGRSSPLSDASLGGARHAFAPARSDRLEDLKTEAQFLLLEQLSRAASQGLVNVDLSLPAATGTGQGADKSIADPSPLPDKPATAEPLRVRTSVEAVPDGAGDSPAQTAEGETCPPESSFALASWANDEAPVSQIAGARRALLGEFDEPDPEAIRTLARLYIALSMGPEAMATLRAFDQEDEILFAMARILEGQAVDHPEIFARFADCRGPVALWSALAAPDAGAVPVFDTEAILRTFQSYPDAVRRALAPDLATFFLQRGENEAVRILSNAMTRTIPENLAVADLIEARLAQVDGRPEPDPAVDALALSNDPLAPEATLSAIERRLAAGQVVPERLASHAEALAAANAGTPASAELAAAAALSWASLSAFAQAQETLDRALRDLGPEHRVRVLTRYAGMLTEKADDASFLAQVFSRRDWMVAATIGARGSLQVARRLSDLGFDTEAVSLAGDSVASEETAQLFVARGYLALGLPATGASSLSALRAEALVVQARAAERAGRTEEAVDGLAAAGMQEEASMTAWRAGMWTRAEALGSGVRRRALELARPPETRADEATPLAAAQALIERSRDLRGVFEEVLAKQGS